MKKLSDVEAAYLCRQALEDGFVDYLAGLIRQLATESFESASQDDIAAMQRSHCQTQLALSLRNIVQTAVNRLESRKSTRGEQ